MKDLNSNETEELKISEKKEKRHNPYEPDGFAGSVYSVVHDVVCILSVIVIMFVFAARLVGVSGISMNPTLVGEDEDMHTGGDYLILRSNFLCASYEQGDIVVACIPTFKEGEPIVKRVIATGGQTVSFENGEDGFLHVFVDGERQSEEHINEPMHDSGNGRNGYTVTVPENCYFLMGDNRNRSWDSRFDDVGMVDGRYIVGKALLLAFPGQDVWQENARDWGRIGSIYD